MEIIEPYKGIAEIYDEIRPSYPEKLVYDIISETKLNSDAKLLEIGSGSGKATVQFAEKGFQILAIELGKDMAEICKAKCSMFSNVSIDIASFEEWENANNKRFDMIYSAQAFHWLDRNIKFKKCYDYLKKDGYLALFWYNAVNEDSLDSKKINQNIDDIYDKYRVMGNLNETKRQNIEKFVTEEEKRAEIVESGLFDIIRTEEYVSDIKNSAFQYLKVKKSVPANAKIYDSLSDSRIKDLESEVIEAIKSCGGNIYTRFRFNLYIARKIS